MNHQKHNESTTADKFEERVRREIDLLLAEYKAADDNARIVNVLEVVDEAIREAREDERKKVKDIAQNHLWKEVGTYDFDGIAEDIINYVDQNENK